MENLIDVVAFTDPITVIEDGELLDNAHLKPTAQALANRTAFLNSFGKVVDIQTDRMTTAPWLNNQTFNSATFAAVNNLGVSLTGAQAGDILVVLASLAFWNTTNGDATSYTQVRALAAGSEIDGARSVIKTYSENVGRQVQVLAAFPLGASPADPMAITLEAAVHGSDPVDFVGPATLMAALIRPGA